VRVHPLATPMITGTITDRTDGADEIKLHVGFSTVIHNATSVCVITMLDIYCKQRVMTASASCIHH